jgi:hypothetical protein
MPTLPTCLDFLGTTTAVAATSSSAEASGLSGAPEFGPNETINLGLIEEQVIGDPDANTLVTMPYRSLWKLEV